MTHWHNSAWPLLAVRCDILILLAASQKFKQWTSLAAASSIVQAEGEQERWPTVPPG